MNTLDQTTIPCISVNDDFISVFTEVRHQLAGRGDVWITEQQDAVNFRYRNSPSHYASDWHVAGDPTLIIICTGAVEIELRDGSTKAFGPGGRFIAADYLPRDTAFDSCHGHRAQVISDTPFSAIHLKLAERP